MHHVRHGKTFCIPLLDTISPSLSRLKIQLEIQQIILDTHFQSINCTSTDNQTKHTAKQKHAKTHTETLDQSQTN